MANQYDPYYTHTGTAADVNTAFTFIRRTKGVDVTVFDNPVYISAAYEDDYEGDIELNVGSNPLPLAVNAIRIRNKTAGQNARYVITGYIMPTDYA